jgi:CO/xanthine dehydrogenase FAD-binding subunit
MDLNTVQGVVAPARRADIPPWTHGDAFLAGGTWLFSEPQIGVRRLVDLAALGWPSLEVDADGLTIAATCRITELYRFNGPTDWRAAPLFGQCCHALLGSFKIWNAATVGGNICLALPAGPMTALTAALDGVCVIWEAGGGEHEIPVVDFVQDVRTTALHAGDVLRAIRLPAAALRRRAAFRQMSLTPFGRSAALLIGTLCEQTGFAVTITGSTRRPVRLSFATIPAESELHGAIDGTVTAWFDDQHGAPDWRRHISLRMAEDIRRALAGGDA